MATAMACNFLVDENKNPDNASEYSETGSTGWDPNWDSKGDLIELMAKLGIQDTADLHRERFTIDRRKLEQMLTGGEEVVIPADVFFSKMMEDTNTCIFWPNRLKIGAKSKKDPNIRVIGRYDDVQLARIRITNLLGRKSSRITMKMDVSYTDHSHIIGRGGLSIKRVMEESQCHVHFPDSNRVSFHEKSNQVSISGNIEKVEKARSRVRDLIPLIFCFELPITTKNIDITSAYVAKIQEQYKVQVTFKSRHAKLHATLVMVKGVEWEADQVKKATLVLIDYMCDNLANQTAVQMSIEISPQHHPIVLGKDHSNLKAIAKLTSCKIMFPDAQDPNIPSLKKSNVVITGNINDVYRARQLLMGSLPLTIIFDLSEDSISLMTNHMNEIQKACDVTISIRQKSKQNTKVCLIKGIEKHASNIYKARNLILGIDDPPLVADIPSSYHFPAQSTSFIPTPSNPNPAISHPISPVLSPLLSPFWNYPSVPSPSPIPPQLFGIMPQPHFAFNVTQQSLGSSGYHSMNQTQYVSNSLAAFEQNNNSSLSTISSNSSLLGPNFRLFPDASSVDKRDVFTTSPDFPTTYRSSPASKNERHNGHNAADESKRFAGLRAIQNRRSVSSYRVPTDFWSGYGISHSSPNNVGKSTETKMDDDIWRMPTSPVSETRANISNLVEYVPTNILSRLINSEWNDIADLLTSLGLERYISLFTRYHIDLTFFATMNEANLIWIGVNSSEARRRILLAICELNKRSRTFMLAPGEERGSEGN